MGLEGRGVGQRKKDMQLRFPLCVTIGHWLFWAAVQKERKMRLWKLGNIFFFPCLFRLFFIARKTYQLAPIPSADESLLLHLLLSVVSQIGLKNK